jgi:List-Bact-rpt repeat protein
LMHGLRRVSVVTWVAVSVSLLLGLLSGSAFGVARDRAEAATAREHSLADMPKDTLGARFLSGGASSHVLPRATIDRPDDVAGSQIHVIYALPSDGTDRTLDQSGTLEGSVASWNAWLAAQTGGRNFRLDTSNGLLDITFVRLAETDAQIEAQGVYARDELERRLHGLGFNQPRKVYAVYYDGRHSFSCGDGPWPPDLPGNVVALYLHGLYRGPRPCDTNPWGSASRPGYLEFAMVHEVMHALGFVPTCAPHQTRRGHVSDSPSDLMYAGAAPWSPTTLDVGHDDYYNAHIPGCPDLSDSPYLEQIPSFSLTVAVNGKGSVSALVGATDDRSCRSRCAFSYVRGSTVTLSANPAVRYRFAGWRGACSGTGDCGLTLTGPTSVTATFLLKPKPKCRKGQRSTRKHPCVRR